MHQHIDPILLAAGLCRVLVWATVAIVAYRTRRLLPVLYAPPAALTSAVFTITNAHGTVPQWLASVSTFVALPVAALVLCSVLVTQPTLPAPRSRRGWRL